MASPDSSGQPGGSSPPAPVGFLLPISSGSPGLRVPLHPPMLTIGRDTSNALCLQDDEWVSRWHCVIHVIGSTLLIEDCSRNGTFVDGQPVRGVAPLPLPSSIIVGRTMLSVVPAETAGPLPTDGETVSNDTDARVGTAEALLLVDMVESTTLLLRDERAYVDLVLQLGRFLEGLQARQREPFVKCTGDGFCTAFATAPAALAAAGELEAWVTSKLHDPIRLVVALHWGAALRLKRGDRTGPAIRVLSSVDELRHIVPTLREDLDALRSGTLVLMTEPFWARLSEEARSRCRPIGRYELAGLDGATGVYRWQGRGSGA